jgi:hypothetical protein
MPQGVVGLVRQWQGRWRARGQGSTATGTDQGGQA